MSSVIQVRRMMPLILAVLAVGCHGTWALRNPTWPDMYGLNQEQDLAYVRQHLPAVQKGMSQQEVLRLLGKPGEVYHGGWDYFPLDEEGRAAHNSAQGMVMIRFDAQGRVLSTDDISDARGTVGVGGGYAAPRGREKLLTGRTMFVTADLAS